MRHNASDMEFAKERPYMKPLPILAGAVLLCAATAPAWATLGGDPTSVEADRAHMKGALRVSAADTTPYSVHEITTATGMTVREYVAGGKVFGFSWRGNTAPDLRQLLGSYYGQFAEAASTPHAINHHHLSVEAPGLRVYSGARSRAFYGRAWAPDLIPQGVSTDDIK
jgi:Protein of unknown function (DUF2844)